MEILLIISGAVILFLGAVIVNFSNMKYIGLKYSISSTVLFALSVIMVIWAIVRIVSV